MNFQGNLKGQVALFTGKIISRLAGTTLLQISAERRPCGSQIPGMLPASLNYRPTRGITLQPPMMERIMTLQSIGFFYRTLVEDKKEPVYYGESVGPDDADKVLLKWKVSDDHYRVIFGDLTAEDITAEKWKEFER
jgi:hypothetical protein